MRHPGQDPGKFRFWNLNWLLPQQLTEGRSRTLLADALAKPRAPAPVPPILPQAQDRATVVGPGHWTWPLDLKSVQLSLNPLLGHLQETQWDPRGDQGAERVHFGVP